MKVLIVVDMQNDFVTGSLGTKEAQNIVPKVKEKIKEYQENQDLVFFTRDTHYDSNYMSTQEGINLPVKHCINKTEGWQIVTDLQIADCLYLNKTTFGWPCWDITFENVMNDKGIQEIDEIELVGVCTDICVISNALILKATFPEVKVTVDSSCCAGVTPELHKAALDVMRSCQVNIIGG